jgi:hypothetical protein
MIWRVDENEPDLPGWAARARRLFQALFLSLSAFGALALALRLIGHVLDADLVPESSSWLAAMSGAFMVTWLFSGVLWLAGAVVAGYRETEG